MPPLATPRESGQPGAWPLRALIFRIGTEPRGGRCVFYIFFSVHSHTHTRNRLTKRACVSAWLRAFLGGAALPTACDRRAANDRTPDASRIRFLAGGREDPQPERAHALLASRERRARASEVREGPAIQNSCGNFAASEWGNSRSSFWSPRHIQSRRSRPGKGTTRSAPGARCSDVGQSLGCFAAAPGHAPRMDPRESDTPAI